MPILKPKNCSKVLILTTVLLITMTTSSCRKRINHLYSHVDRLHEIYVEVEAPRAPKVYLGYSSQKESFSAAMSNLSTQLIAQELETKLRDAAPSNEMVDVFTETFLKDVHGFMQFEEIESVRAPCDAELNIAIKDYGIRSYSAEGAVFYTLSAEVNIFDCNTGETIWNDWIDYNEQITPHSFAQSGLGKSIGTSLNFIALSRLSRQQMHDVFKYLLQDASREIASQMEKDARAPKNSKRRRRSRASR